MVFSVRDSKFRSIITVLFVSWFFLIPVFWSVNLSAPSSGYFDMLEMAPYGVIHVVVFFSLGFLLLYFCRMQRKIVLLSLILFGLYFPSIQLVNYPLLTIRDVYLHSAPVNEILQTGKLSEIADSSASAWPLTFNLHAMLKLVTGIDVVDCNYVLYACLVILLALVVFCVGAKLCDRGYKFGFFGALLFPCLFINHLFDNFHHYSRTALSFVFLFLFFFLFLRARERKNLALSFFLAIAVIIAHPFQGLALVAFVVGYFLFKASNRSLVFTLFVSSFYVGWTFLQNPSEVVSQLQALRTFSIQEYFKPATVTFVTTKTSVPIWSVYLTDLFKYVLLFLFALGFLGIAIRVSRRQLGNEVVSWASSVWFSSLVMLGFLLLLPDWQINRFTAFAAFPAAFSSIIFLETIFRKNKTLFSRFHLPKKFMTETQLRAILLVLILGLSASVIILRFQVNYYYGEMRHQSELTALSYLHEHENSPSTITFISWRTSIYYNYFDYSHMDDNLMLWYLDLNKIRGNFSEVLMYENDIISRSTYVVRGFRDSYTLGVGLEGVVQELDNSTLKEFNRYYSNGFFELYCRENP